MASLVLGAAGAAVGSFFGPIGASLGWSIGAAAGNLLFPGKGQDGPRLTDLKLQNSAYGQMIPILFGTVRISGNVMWQTDLVEHEHHHGGKGGEPESTTFSYTASFAVELCEGPIGGVLRIWADSRLVWDSSQSLSTDFPFTLYLGTATQLVDPTMEAIEGVGNVPAYRNIAYVVFTDMEMEQFSNRIPSLTFEVFTSSSGIPWLYSNFTPTNDLSQAGPNGMGPESGKLIDGDLVMATWTFGPLGSGPTYEKWRYDLNGNLLETFTPVACEAMPGVPGGFERVLPCSNDPRICWSYGEGAAGPSTGRGGFYYDGVLAFSDLGSQTINKVFPVLGDEAVYTLGQPSTLDATPTLIRWDAPGGVPINSGSAGIILPPTGTAVDAYVLACDEHGDVWVLNTHSAPTFDILFHYDGDLNLIHSWAEADAPAGINNGSIAFTVWNNILFVTKNPGSASYAYFINADNTFTLADPGSISSAGYSPPNESFGNLISLGNGLVLTHNGLVSLVPPAEPVTLASIVSALSVRAGLTTAQIDVSELTDLVDGYVIGNQADARTCIEPLQVAWPFDAVEHDTVVRFPRRGVDGLQAVLDDIDLGAFVPPGDPPALMTTDRMQETDLPRVVNATFLNKDTDYQNGEERAQRLITTSDLETSLQLPIVMTSAKALNVCEVTLYQAWIERERFSIQVPRKWILLEPSDLIQANGRQFRITRKTEQADGIVKIDGVAANLAIYNHAAPAAEGVGMPGGGGTPPTSPPVLQDTDLLLLDLPLIRDTDNPVGFYAAMAGHTQPSWPGATLYKSIDGVTYNPELVDTVSDTFGDCSTTLGDFTGGNIVDESNSLTVVLSAGAGTLSSVTNLALMNGANKAAVGTLGTTGVRQIEIIQYRDAILTAPSTYVLSGLLRGRRGSEWMIPLHVSGEKFVALPTSANVNGDPSEIFLPRSYSAVTSGKPLSSGVPQSFTNWGIAAKPYAPVHLNGGRQTNGDIILTWTRRTRIGGLWTPFVDVPLAEATEYYRIILYTDSTYATTAFATFATVETCTLTAAELATFFGSPSPAPLYWGVSQLGTYGYGTEARGAI